ncbi:hypothetical protein EVAR_102200_1 [Eumeta japonica]|uniref:Uncharacterized protein n=1 Tax=Eumeta variegata TaxID=151549 RepID=A0A4C1WGK1_EUMVA|nr:hypothetical protein EVAR_102200_1 [Eumeta japonica]
MALRFIRSHSTGTPKSTSRFKVTQHSFQLLDTYVRAGGRARASAHGAASTGEYHISVGGLPTTAPTLPDTRSTTDSSGKFIHYEEMFSLRLGVTYEKGVTLGNVTMSHRTRESPPNALRLSPLNYDRSAARAD